VEIRAARSGVDDGEESESEESESEESKGEEAEQREEGCAGTHEGEAPGGEEVGQEVDFAPGGAQEGSGAEARADTHALFQPTPF
jgi:hypothetical protein